ncbi:MAG: Heme/hemopexin transporter protein HuxB [Syntrophus sp. SKADARSKE-3]|nr:Heme/hemopexin transporter protein HuxB [Syntrophus sp. SKADARSKE-3]
MLITGITILCIVSILRAWEVLNYGRCLVFSVVLFVFIITIPAYAAAPPDAGQLLNEQRQIKPTLPDRLPKEGDQGVNRMPLTDQGIKVLVKGFKFTGGQGIVTDAELLVLLKDAIGKELGFADLQNLTVRVTAYLRDKKGYILASAYLPRQDITDGVIEIAIVAGRIEGKARINVKEPRRIGQGLLEGIAERSIPTGDAIRLENIERSVLLMNDLPGISARASLERGELPGTARIVIDAVEGPLVSGFLSGDNYGDRYTGTWRGTGRPAINDPFGLGDQFSISLTGAEHLYQGGAAYALPLGATGLTWSTAYTALYYEVGGDLSNLNAKGNGQTVSTAISYPFMRSRNTNLLSGLGFEYMSFHDEAGGVTTRDRKVPVGNLNLTGSFFDDFGGGGLTSLYLVLSYGDLRLSGTADAESTDANSARSAESFVKANYSVARLQHITRLISIYGSAQGQFAGKNLDSSQKFILGGPSRVRAYPTGEASGDEGHAFTFEVRLDLPVSPSWPVMQLTGFYDAGYVNLHKNTWAGSVTNATGRNDYWLSGAGVGFNIGKAGLYSIRVSYALKINDNPGRSDAGYDADNLKDYGRAWLQVTVWF